MAGPRRHHDSDPPAGAACVNSQHEAADGNPGPLGAPAVDWDDVVPRSREYDDIYFARARPDAESRYVFLSGNRLPERLAKAEHFVVGETGFGTGLNFLLCRELWRRVAPCGGQLDFVSVELHPLPLDDLRRAHRGFPALGALGGDLRAVWPPAEPGFRRLDFDGGCCRLTLLFGEVGQMLGQLDIAVNAWFLDGFAPARNPDMWRAEVLDRVGALSVAGTTFATFTAAGHVRRGLERAGFRVSKRPGFGRKREMLLGCFRGAEAVRHHPPWYASPIPAASGRVAVIGAGLAGCSVAQALARRGREVLILDRRDHEAAEASGNRAGVVMPLVSSIRGLPQRWYTAGFRYALDRYHALGELVGWQRSGVLHCAIGDDDSLRLRQAELRRIWPQSVARTVSTEEASAIAGVPVPWPALYFPEAGWVEPRALCAAYLSEETIEARFGCHVTALEHDGEQWLLSGEDGRSIARVTAVIVCTGVGLGDFRQTSGLTVQPVRGQVTHARRHGTFANLRVVLGGMGYTIPGLDGTYVIGASYDPDDLGRDLREFDHRSNLERLETLCPTLRGSLDETRLGGRAAVRAASADTLPLIGPVPDVDGYERAYLRLDLGRRFGAYPSAPYHRGLYVSGGFGSRALTSAPLAAEMLACVICGTPAPVEKRLIHALHPARFIVRRLSRS